MADILIIGSGAAGAAAALQFTSQGIRPIMIDVGYEAGGETPLEENLYDFCEDNDGFEILVGKDFEGLANLDPGKPPVPAKLTSPRIRFVTGGSEILSPVDAENFGLIQSFALGGLGNAWGAGLMRFTDRDLENFPISEADLHSYYDRLSREIGISGANDDLAAYFGEDDNLQPPLNLSLNASHIMRRYDRKKSDMNKKGVFIGRPRLGILTRDLNGRKAFTCNNLEFWQPGLTGVYSPDVTVKKLMREGRLDYRPGLLAERWTREGDTLRVRARSVRGGEAHTFECKRLVLAAGAVNSAKLALSSREDYETRLTLLDNPALQFPLVFPHRIGGRLETEAFGLTQLNLIYDSEDYGLIQGSILEVTSPPRAEFFSHFPLAARDNIRLLRYMLPALMVMQVFFPASAPEGVSLRLTPGGILEIRGKGHAFSKPLVRKLIRICRSVGALTIYPMTVFVTPGHGIHYAGTLPMSKNPASAFCCTPEGELSGEPGVFVVDAAVFPRLPAKNFSFAVMANAMRIADGIISRGIS